MRTWIFLSVALGLCACEKPKEKRTIQDYVGRWVTPTMSDLFLKDGFNEMAADIRAGKMAQIQDLTEEERSEMETELGKPLSEVTGDDVQKLTRTVEMMEGGPLADMRIGIEITADSRLILFFIIMGEEQVGFDEPAKFTLTDDEIIYKTESDSGLIFFDGDNLKMENEEVGHYPRFFTLTRVEESKDTNSAEEK